MAKEGLLDLNEAVQHPGKRLSFEVSTALEQEEDIDLIEPVNGEIEAVSSGSLLFIESGFTTTTVLECARCSRPLQTVVEFEMSEQFDIEGVPGGYGSGGYAEVLADEAEPLFVKNSLVRDAWVRQALLTALPMQPLCEFGWDGPCPYAKVADAAKATGPGHPGLAGLKEIDLTGEEQ